MLQFVQVQDVSLKSDYDRIEIESHFSSIFDYSILKSDYDRIEICFHALAHECKSFLKSDYDRIEMEAVDFLRDYTSP